MAQQITKLLQIASPGILHQHTPSHILTMLCHLSLPKTIEFARDYNSSVHNDPCDLPQFSVEIIDTCINKLKLGKVQDPDGLSEKHLVHSQSHIHSLTYIFAISLRLSPCMVLSQMILA